MDEGVLIKLIGCDEAIWRPFNMDREIGVLARWGTAEHAVRVPTTGREPHQSNSDWECAFPVEADFLDAVQKLKAARNV